MIFVTISTHINFVMKKFLFSLLVLIFLVIPSDIFAANEFSSAYTVNYSVNPDGVTEVVEEIKLKNLTEKFFPSSFSVVLPGNNVTDAKASDAQGLLEVSSAAEGSNTKLTVKFSNQQIIGLNKEYAFKLTFKDSSIAKSLGESWMISIPKLTQGSEVTDSTFTLSVPTAFGDPDYIAPEPAKTAEAGGRIVFTYNEKDFFASGITAVFGRELNFFYKTGYILKNDSIFPKYVKIVLPSDSRLQKSYLESIDPKPENTETDKLGNTLAVFKLSPAQILNVSSAGQVKTLLSVQGKDLLNNEEKIYYTDSSRYWDVSSPVIKNKLSEILATNNPSTNFEKAREIDKFVSNFLRFNPDRLNRGFDRFGSVTALNNPEQALAAEFVDLEIALLRSAGIPARQIIGFSLNSDGKPFSFTSQKLHTWVEFYDDEKGWVISDPAWENTTKGINFFAFNDLTHIRLAVSKGRDDFILPAEAEAGIFDGELSQRQGAQLGVEVAPEILSGFPAKAKIRITNLGNTSFPASELRIDASKILLVTGDGEAAVAKVIKTPVIPPFGNLEYDLNLKTGAIWHSYQDVLQVTFAGVTDTHVISVVPVLSYRIFALEIIGAIIIIVLFYTAVFLIHHKSARNSQ